MKTQTPAPRREVHRVALTVPSKEREVSRKRVDGDGGECAGCGEQAEHAICGSSGGLCERLSQLSLLWSADAIIQPTLSEDKVQLSSLGHELHFALAEAHLPVGI